MSGYPTNRLRRILGGPRNKALIVPIDDSLISGPFCGLSNMRATVEQIVMGRPDAILGFAGQFSRFSDLLARADLGWIFNVTASVIGPHHTNKRLVQSVESAAHRGCDAVAAHVNLTSRHEPHMIETLGHVIDAGDAVGLPTVAIIYPRKEASDGGDDNYATLRQENPAGYADLVARCVRLGADLGAAIVKTQYTGDVATFNEICRANDGVAVLAAGGPLLSRNAALDRVREIATTEAAGISFGRNTFCRTDVSGFISQCRAILEQP